jgi:enoyl-CoA hydratase/carnithine racemase
MLDAEAAQRVGLVTDACPPAELDGRVRSLAEELAALPPLAVREIKRCVLDGLDGHLAAGLALEERANLALAGTADAREGVRAFVERRAPVFEGR